MWDRVDGLTLGQIGPAGTATQQAPAVPATGGGPTAVPATTAPGGATPPAANRPPGIMDSPWFILGLLGLFVVMMLFRKGGSKEEKARKALLDNLKRGDKVMTIGGLIGKVVEVQEDHVVLKVDESNNVKETYTKRAIQEVLVDKTDEKITRS